MISNLGFPTRLAALFGAVAAVSSAGANPTLITAAVALPKSAPKLTAALNPNALNFVPNEGQWDSQAKFLAKTPGMNFWVIKNGVVYDFQRYISQPRNPELRPALQDAPRLEGHAVAMKFAGANANSTEIGVDEKATRISYLLGEAKVPNVSVYRQAMTVGLYDGIDLRTYIEKESPRFDLIVKPGADPSQIRMSFEGADSISVSGSNVLIGTRFGSRPLGGLYAYQIVNGKQVPVSVAFQKNAAGEVTLALGKYDSGINLVIDPIVYSTLLGGTGGQDIPNDIVVDQFGHAYVCGVTNAATFPTSFGAYDETVSGIDGFVTKMLPDGTDVVWSTVIGGIYDDRVLGLGLSPTNQVFMTGRAGPLFPVTFGPAFGTPPPVGGWGPPAVFPPPPPDGWFGRLSTDGSTLDFARYVGGPGSEFFSDLEIDQSGSFYIGGTFASPALASGSINSTLRGTTDALIMKVSGASGLVTWSTYVGGTELPPLSGGVDSFADLAVDLVGNVYISGTTNASDFGTLFTLAGNYDRSVNLRDTYLVKIESSGATLAYGTLLGGNANESGSNVAVDLDGFAYVVTSTTSFNYPISPGAFDTSYNNGTDWALTKVSRNGGALEWSTFLGYGVGSGGPLTFTPAIAMDIAIDDLGAAYIVGLMPNTEFPTLIPDQAAYAGPTDANRFQGDGYLQVMASSGSAMIYSSFWGGARQDYITAVALDGARNALVTGATISAITDANGQTIVGFPTTAGAFKANWVYDGPVPPPAQPGDESLEDGFVSKIKVRIPTVIQSVVVNPDLVAAGEPSAGVVTLAQPASTGGALVTIESENTGVVQVSPSQVLIPEGGTTANFNITTNASITDKFVIKVMATVEGDTKFDTITVGPWLDSLTLSNATVIGGNPVGGRVNLIKNAPNGGITITLNTTVPAVATVPATITVPAGLNTATFDVETVGVSSDTLVTISGAFAGTTRFKELVVKPAQLMSLNLNPSTVAGGSPSVGTVNLNGEAPPGGFFVTLSKPGAPGDAFVTIPASATIAAGDRSVTFPVTTTVAPSNTFSVIRASANGINADATLSISNILLFDFTVAPTPIPGGGIVTGTVQLNQPAPPGGAVVDLSMNPGNLGAFVPGGPSNLVVTGPTTATITVPAGQIQASFEFQTFTTLGPGNVSVFLSASRGGAPIVREVQISPLGHTISISPNSILGGQNSQLTVTLTGPAPAGGASFSVSKVSQLPNPPDNSGAITVNGGNNLFIAQGLSSATFQITTIGVPTTDTVNITATGTVSGVSASAPLTVRAPKATSISFNPQVVRGLFSTNLTVTLDGPAPAGGAVVALTEQAPNGWIANVPPSITVPAGQTSATISVSTNKVSRTLGLTVFANFGGNSVSTVLFVTR